MGQAYSICQVPARPLAVPELESTKKTCTFGKIPQTETRMKLERSDLLPDSQNQQMSINSDAS